MAPGLAIVGAAESDLGEAAPGTTPLDLMAQASRAALADAGLELRDVDALFAASSQYPCRRSASASTSASCRATRDTTRIGGSSFLAHLNHAAAAIAAGCATWR